MEEPAKEISSRPANNSGTANRCIGEAEDPGRGDPMQKVARRMAGPIDGWRRRENAATTSFRGDEQAADTRGARKKVIRLRYCEPARFIFLSLVSRVE